LRLAFTSGLVKLSVCFLYGFLKAFSLTGFTNALYHPRLHFAPRTASPSGAEKRPLDVIKLDIINRVADKTGVPKMKAEQAVEALFHSMKEALTRGERIELRGFGVFVVKPRKRGVGRNPRTGEEVAIPSGKTIRFKPGKELQAHEDGDTLVDDSTDDEEEDF
jgi:DNA-binding protein HU-beta